MPKLLSENPADAFPLLADAMAGSLGTTGPDGPLATPVNYLFLPEHDYAARFGGVPEAGIGGRIYIHGALSGQRHLNVAADPRVCFNVYKLERMLLSGDRACDCAVRYTSALCFGRARYVPDGELKIELLRLLSEKYMQQPVEKPETEASVETSLLEIMVQRVTYKSHAD